VGRMRVSQPGEGGTKVRPGAPKSVRIGQKVRSRCRHDFGWDIG